MVAACDACEYGRYLVGRCLYLSMEQETFYSKLGSNVTATTYAILMIAAVAVIGLMLGSVRVAGIGLGTSGVLFAGILFGHFGAAIDHQVAHFAKEFGLILFVYTMGIQLGPGIIQLWKRQGISLNLMAFAIVAQGTLLAIGLGALGGLSPFATAGLFSGATTNTPSLGSAQQATTLLDPENNVGQEALAAAYAVAYPGGIVGIILSMLLLRKCFGIHVPSEREQLLQQEAAGHEPLERRCVLVDNKHLNGIAFGQIPGVEEIGVRISRIRRAGQKEISVATESTVLHADDVVQVVGEPTALARFIPLIGEVSSVNLMEPSGAIEFRRVVVTAGQALNKTLRELSLDQLYNASVTRINRAGVEMTARGSSRLYFGDVLHVVGDQQSLNAVTSYLGNSTKSLSETPFFPLFAGILAGVGLGMIPFPIPGVPFPIRLGLAGGPLLAAIVFSLIGSVGGLVWYIPSAANLALRQLGIILFLASAGLGAGEAFFRIAMSGEGLRWIGIAISVTMLPLLSTAAVARIWGKQNFLTMCGVIAGGMTDPPALAFANSLTESEHCSTAYAAVYPLTMVLRIIAAQAIIFLMAAS